MSTRYGLRVVLWLQVVMFVCMIVLFVLLRAQGIALCERGNKRSLEVAGFLHDAGMARRGEHDFGVALRYFERESRIRAQIKPCGTLYSLR